MQGQLDTQVPPSNADPLETLARARKKARRGRGGEGRRRQSPAGAGEDRRGDEYAQLGDASVSEQVTGAVATWLTRTLAPAR